MVHWLDRRGQQLLLAKVKNADWQDWYILILVSFTVQSKMNFHQVIGVYKGVVISPPLLFFRGRGMLHVTVYMHVLMPWVTKFQCTSFAGGQTFCDFLWMFNIVENHGTAHEISLNYP